MLFRSGESENDNDLLDIAGEIIDELSTTYNAPSDWRSVGENLADIYKGTWVYDRMNLWEYED